MTLQTFRDLLGSRPFRPFRIVMSSGESHEVRHPELAWLTKTDLLIATNLEDGVPANYRICSLLHVTAIEPLPLAAA